MQISFHGAARTVTGSKHLVSLKNRTRFLLDCGLFQGCGSETESLNSKFGFDPAIVKFVFLSHAHIDHSGLLPKLVKEGFNGKIFCTAATAELAEILLYDSAEIQASDADVMNRRRAAKNLEPVDPLYSVEDVAKTVSMFKVVEYDKPFKPTRNVTAVYTNNGHLIGSAAIHLTVSEGEEETRLLFSGDVGRYRSALLQPPADTPAADYIILESTYGDKHHNIAASHVDALRKQVIRTCIEKQGKLIIPAFSVGRTQEILYALNQLELEKRLPEMNYFVDSPLSNKATDVLKKYPHLFNDTLQNILKVDSDPFMFQGLKHLTDVNDSITLKETDKPCVIISASGTGDAGRVRHHISSCIHNRKNTILFAGYCGSGSLGGELLSGAQAVEIFGESVNVETEIDSVEGMSAHGDVDDLLQFLQPQDPSTVKGIFLVHGEFKTQQAFAAKLETKNYSNIVIPQQHSKVKVTGHVRTAAIRA
jgi:metallo-beta-lactamase family protein